VTVTDATSNVSIGYTSIYHDIALEPEPSISPSPSPTPTPPQGSEPNSTSSLSVPEMPTLAIIITLGIITCVIAVTIRKKTNRFFA
jgi:hypothetical protein